MKKILSKSLLLIFFNFFHALFGMEERNKSQITFNIESITSTQRSMLLGNSMSNYANRVNTMERVRAYQPHVAALPRFSQEQKQKFFESQKISSQVTFYAEMLSKAGQGQSAASLLNLTNPLSFQVPGLNRDFTVQNAHLQELVNNSLYVLYKPDGMPKTQLQFGEQCALARMVTNYLKQEIPDQYNTIVEDFAAAGMPGYAQILKEQNKWRPFNPEYQIPKEYPSNPAEFKDKILKNPNVRNLNYVMQCCKDGKFDVAKGMLDVYERQAMYNSSSPQEDYAAMRSIYDEFFEKFCVEKILKPNNIAATPEIMDILHKIGPYVTDYPQKVMNHLIHVLNAKQHDSAYYDAIKSLFDERGLPCFYTYENLFKDIAIPSSITLPEHLKEREMLFKLTQLDFEKKFDTEAYRKAVGYVAKACSDVHNKKHYSELAERMISALEGKGDSILLRCPNLAQANLNESQERIEQRAIPSILNLLDEIDNKTKGYCYARQERSLIETLMKQYSELDGSLEKQLAFDVTIKEIVHKLNALGHVELRRSISQEILFWDDVELLTTGQDASYNQAGLERSVGIEAKTLDKEIRYHQKLMAELPAKTTKSPFDTEQSKEFLQKVHEMLEEARRLCSDNRLTLAKGASHVAKDACTIVLTDFPLKEIAARCKEIVSDPAEYVLGSIKSVGELANFIKDYVEHNSMLSTVEQQLDYAQRWNKSIHGFFEGWDNLKYDQKKEFVARLIVDTVLAKGGGKAVQSVSNSVSNCIIDFCHDIGPSRFDGGGAVLSKAHVIAQEVLVGAAEAAEVVGNVAASTPMAVAVGGNHALLELSQATNGGNSGGSDNFDSQLGRLIPKTPIEASIKSEKDILYTVESFSNNTIKEEITIIRKQFDHIFSPDHQLNGIMKLGENKDSIFKEFINVLLKAESGSLLGENGNQIEAVINGFTATVRVHIINGKVTSFDGFMGTSPRILGKLTRL